MLSREHEPGRERHHEELAAPSGALPLSLFDYELPPELIAQQPVSPRDTSRLLVLPRHQGAPTHHRFVELPELLAEGDLLVVNRTRVIKARLALHLSSGGKAELLLFQPHHGTMAEATHWLALGKPMRSLRPGREVIAADGTRLRIEAREGDHLVVSAEEPMAGLLERLGELPLPPYIKRDAGPSPTDAERYQTIFAAEPGAVAAPTASLHFTEPVLGALRARGIVLADVLLHVGPGTFLPVREEHENDVRGHVMHAEWYCVPAETRALIEAAKGQGRRVIAVGTTSARALETWAQTGAATGDSRLFIYPGFQFGLVDGLLTNFHLPRSTLLMLVSALAGRERVLSAYAVAVSERYRFFSYGDAMLIV